MSDIAVIIPSRLNAKRLPNKPLKLIKNKEMILHVHDLAKKANVGEVIVATPDQKIYDLVKRHGGLAEITKETHETGTDRVFEVFEKKLEKKPKIIINFQGDMPNLNSSAIQSLVKLMSHSQCEIGTLASDLEQDKEERPFNTITIGLEADRTKIYERINDRVDIMMAEGLLKEVKSLEPYKNYNALNTVGYKELFNYLDDEWSLEFAISEIKKNTRRFAKRQLTWFKKNSDTLWFNYKTAEQTIIKVIDNKMQSQ